MDSEDDLYDEFGNLIGDANDSDAESSSGKSEIANNNGEEEHDDDDEMMVESQEQAIVLAEDKKIYSTLEETFGPDVETIIATEDAQDLETPLVKPLQRDIFQLQELNLPTTVYSKEYMLELSKIPERVRNISITGGLHSGKTSFVDMLLKQTHPELKQKTSLSSSAQKTNELKYTDIHVLEQSKKMSIKTTPLTILLPDLQSRSMVVNLIDSPGHINFLDEVSVAQATADITLICIDVVEGLTTMDETIIKNSLARNIPMAFILNKIDRLILELRLPPSDSYFKLRSIMDDVNTLIEANVDPDYYSFDTRFSPELGNVIFASSKYQFCFNLKSFVQTIHGGPAETEQLEQFSEKLWGDIFYIEESHKFTSKPADKTAYKRSFVAFVLEPLYKIFTNCLVQDSGKDLQQFLIKNFDFKIDNKLAFTLDSESMLKLVLSHIFNESVGFVDMLKQLPSPVDCGSKKLKQVQFKDKSPEVEKAINACDPEGPLIAHITKLIDTVDSSRFYAMVSVLSGTLHTDTEIGYKIVGEKFLEDEEDSLEAEVLTKMYINVARYKIAVQSIPCGNIGLIMSNNLDSFITKTGTILDNSSNFGSVPDMIFTPLNYMIQPIFKVAIEPKNPSELHKLLEGFRKVNRSYVGCEIKVEESGEHVVLGSGEVYMDCLLHDLRKLYTKIDIKVSDPWTKFAETCVDESITKIPVKSQNGLNEICIVIESLELEIQQDIEDNIFEDDEFTTSPRKLAKWFRQQYGWDSLAARSIWSMGADSHYPNILLDDTLPDEVDKERLLNLKQYIVAGFQWAMREGPLCGEPVRNLKLKIIDVKLAPDLIDCNGGQIIPMVRNACYASMLLASPRLLEPVYKLDIVAKLSNNNESLALEEGLTNLLTKRRGHIVSNQPIPATQFQKYLAKVPTLDSVGLETDIRLRTQGQAMCFMSMSNWDVMPGDPMDKLCPLPPLKPVPYKSLARDCVLKTRKRKGISGEPNVGKYIEAELLQDLKESGILDE